MALGSIIGAYTHTQSVLATSWIINHNLDTNSPCTECFELVNGLLTRITPISVEATSNAVVTITFGSAITGEAVII